MEQAKDESPDISKFERLLDQNWNERKHLVETAFELRGEIQSLVQQGGSLEQFQDARRRERECTASLSRNDGEYDSAVEALAAETFKSKP